MTPEIYAAQTALLTAFAAFCDAQAFALTTEQPALAATCSKISDLLTEMEGMTPEDDTNFNLRRQTLSTTSNIYANAMQATQAERLQSLQFNGIEIDTELIRIFLFGQNLVAMPNP